MKQNPSPNSKKPPLSCPSCNFTCSSIQNLRIHFQQTNHKPLEGGKTQNADPTPQGATIPEHIRQSVFVLKDYIHRTDREPVIGLEYVMEYKLQVRPGTNIETKYFCEICEMDSDLVTMMEHLNCHRHRKLYLMKAFPYVLKAPSNNLEDRAQYIRRMAMEIERVEGTKMYKSDSTIRTVL